MKTGVYRGASKKCRGDLILRFYAKGNPTPSERHFIKGGFKAGTTRKVKVHLAQPINEVDHIEVWLERPSNTADVKWFVEHLEIVDETDSVTKHFPFHSLVTMKHQVSNMAKAGKGKRNETEKKKKKKKKKKKRREKETGKWWQREREREIRQYEGVAK